jgi:hypothetical protein
VTTFDAALIKEQGVSFAVVTVKRGVITQSSPREQARAQFSRSFGGVPVVLMEQDTSGTPTYHGRTDLVKLLANCFVEQLPWSRYRLN